VEAVWKIRLCRARQGWFKDRQNFGELPGHPRFEDPRPSEETDPQAPSLVPATQSAAWADRSAAARVGERPIAFSAQVRPRRPRPCKTDPAAR